MNMATMRIGPDATIFASREFGHGSICGIYSTFAIETGICNAKATAGTRKVQITASKDSGPFNPEMGQAPKAQYIPGKYNIETELKAEIVPDGENRFDFDLHSNGKSR